MGLFVDYFKIKGVILFVKLFLLFLAMDIVIAIIRLIIGLSARAIGSIF